MIHSAKTKTVLALAGLVILSGAVGGCTSAKSDYPSFALPTPSEEAGRVSMRFPNVAAKEPVDASKSAEPLPQELDARLAAINTRALKADAAFSAGAPTADRLAQAASLAEVTSDAWAEAQVSLADLTSHHGEGQLALADLDLVAANARIALAEADTIAEIAALQTEIAARLDEQARLLEALSAKLER